MAMVKLNREGDPWSFLSDKEIKEGKDILACIKQTETDAVTDAFEQMVLLQEEIWRYNHQESIQHYK